MIKYINIMLKLKRTCISITVALPLESVIWDFELPVCGTIYHYHLEMYLLWDYLIINWTYYCLNGCKDCIVLGLCTMHCLIYRILFYLFVSFVKHCYLSGLYVGGQHCWTLLSVFLAACRYFFQVLCSYVYLYWFIWLIKHLSIYLYWQAFTPGLS